MRYLGIDFGEKRVGIALSDEDGKIAFPKKVLSNDGELLRNIIDECLQNNAEVIVMGESRDFHGQINEIMWKIQAFRKQLEVLGKQVIYEPEFLTSVQATKITGENDMIDASAAALILQSYLDRQNNLKNERRQS